LSLKVTAELNKSRLFVCLCVWQLEVAVGLKLCRVVQQLLCQSGKPVCSFYYMVMVLYCISLLGSA